MKQIAYIILLIAFSFQPFAKFLIVTNYALNVKTITEQFCENKTKPKMKCNGKCHLKKQLLQHDKQNNQDKNNVKETIAFHWNTFSSEIILKPLSSHQITIWWIYLIKDLNPFIQIEIKPPTC